MAIKARATTASRKCRMVNLRTDHEETVAELRIQKTISSPMKGMTEARFKMTRAAQYDMLPETTT